MAKTDPITPRQLEYLKAIADYIDTHGYPPSLRDLEICMDVSRNGVNQMFVTLIAKGCLTRIFGKSRAITLTEKALDALYPKNHNANRVALLKLPWRPDHKDKYKTKAEG